MGIAMCLKWTDKAKETQGLPLQGLQTGYGALYGAHPRETLKAKRKGVRKA